MRIGRAAFDRGARCDYRRRSSSFPRARYSSTYATDPDHYETGMSGRNYVRPLVELGYSYVLHVCYFNNDGEKLND